MFVHQRNQSQNSFTDGKETETVFPSNTPYLSPSSCELCKENKKNKGRTKLSKMGGRWVNEAKEELATVRKRKENPSKFLRGRGEHI